MRTIGSAILLFVWVMGVVIAQGFWSTFFAFFIPFWAYYLVAERFVAQYL